MHYSQINYSEKCVMHMDRIVNNFLCVTWRFKSSIDRARAISFYGALIVTMTHSIDDNYIIVRVNLDRLNEPDIAGISKETVGDLFAALRLLKFNINSVTHKNERRIARINNRNAWKRRKINTSYSQLPFWIDLTLGGHWWWCTRKILKWHAQL